METFSIKFRVCRRPNSVGGLGAAPDRDAIMLWSVYVNNIVPWLLSWLPLVRPLDSRGPAPAQCWAARQRRARVEVFTRKWLRFQLLYSAYSFLLAPNYAIMIPAAAWSGDGWCIPCGTFKNSCMTARSTWKRRTKVEAASSFGPFAPVESFWLAKAKVSIGHWASLSVKHPSRVPFPSCPRRNLSLSIRIVGYFRGVTVAGYGGTATGPDIICQAASPVTVEHDCVTAVTVAAKVTVDGR